MQPHQYARGVRKRRVSLCVPAVATGGTAVEIVRYCHSFTNITHYNAMASNTI